MNYTIAVFGTTIEESWEFLMSLVNEIPYRKIKTVSNANNIHRVGLHDGTIYIAATCNDHFRGIKFHKAYVSKNIPKEDYWYIHIGICPWNDVEDDNWMEFY